MMFIVYNPDNSSLHCIIQGTKPMTYIKSKSFLYAKKGHFLFF